MESRSGWRAWLEQHHATSPGVWVVTFKRPRPEHVSAREVNQEALCFGWIDSQPRALNAERSQLLVTPRKPAGNWSRVNKQRVAGLTAAGLMHEAGLAAVALAKANGRWSALDEVEDLIEPAELAARLDGAADARRHWDACPSTWLSGPDAAGSRAGDAARDRRARVSCSAGAGPR